MRGLAHKEKPQRRPGLLEATSTGALGPYLHTYKQFWTGVFPPGKEKPRHAVQPGAGGTAVGGTGSARGPHR